MATTCVTKKRPTAVDCIQKNRSIEEIWGELNSITVRNRQTTRRIKVALLERIIRTLMSELSQKEFFELGISLVDEAEMIQLNREFMGHKGTTDVIALDYCEANLAGDIFVCIDEACTQAKRFGTTWQTELVRYVVHGVLHLSGYDDRRLADRRKMKEAEDRLVRELGKRFNLQRLSAKSRNPNAEDPKNPKRRRPKRKARAR